MARSLEPLRPYETTWEDWLLAGGPRAQFVDPDLPLEVEIGPGEDAFLLDSALGTPDHNWLGIEYSRKRVRRYVRRIEQSGREPPNLRLIWRPAADLVRPFLTPGIVSRYHVYFPDPWPKAHHARYRMMAPDFVAALHDSLVPDGSVHIATDDEAYAEDIRVAFGEVEGMRADDAAGPAGAGETVFEARWRAMGRTIHALCFRRVSSPR